MATPPSSTVQPPERHFGYVCCKCQAAAFTGRRYACWLCIGYQLCGSCYDSGQLPESPEHKYFHPLEAHYTRAEYEIYFGGEGYVEARVPQSYKCALCDRRGYSSMQLYKHLSDAHRDHGDFDEYFSILYTRYAADSSITDNMSRSSASAFLRSASSAVQRRVVHRCPTGPPVSFREAVRMTQARRAALLEQQALNVLEELRLGNARYYPQQQQQQQPQQPQRLRQQIPPDVRSPKLGRVRGSPPPMRLGSLFPKPRRAPEDNWVSYWAHSVNVLDQEQQHHHRAELLLNSYADALRELPGESRTKPSKDKAWDKTDKSNEKHKFLCAQFFTLEKAPRKQQHCESQRVLFIEALLCSMLAEEQLNPVNLQPALMLMQTNLSVEPAPNAQSKEEFGASATPPTAAIMERFYKNLDLYNKWLAEFATKKREKNSKIATVPDFILQSTHEPVVGIDSDMDPDTDERDEEDEVAGGEQALPKAKDEPKVELEEEVGDGDGDGDAEDEDVEEEDEVDYDDNSGSETSDSTIAMLVNEIDQVYGY